MTIQVKRTPITVCDKCHKETNNPISDKWIEVKRIGDIDIASYSHFCDYDCLSLYYGYGKKCDN